MKAYKHFFMKSKILFTFLLVFIIIFSFNGVFAGNFTDLNHEINSNNYVILEDDVVLNQNTSDEETIFNEGILISDKELIVDGNNHSISAMDSNENQVKLFNIMNSNVTLSNMIITSANFDGAGGAISLDKNSSLILINITFKDNSACGLYGEGGVIYSKGNLYIYDSIFENNYATGAGGVVYSSTSNLVIYSSKFTNNSANWYGGAIYSDDIFEVSDSVFDSNNAYSGGALHYTVTGDSWDYDEWSFLLNSNFTNNVADFGGVISSSSIKYILTENCNFIGNRANKGGVIYKVGACKPYINNCLIENNSAEIGGVIYDASFDKGYLDPVSLRIINTFINISNSIFKNNNASVKSSAFYGKSSNLNINQSIFYNNGNNPIWNGMGNVTILNSIISDYESDFITQLLGGNLVLLNNTWGVKNPDFALYLRNDLKLGYLKSNSSSSINPYNFINSSDIDCCSVYLRLNKTEFTISHRRDGGEMNMTTYVEKDHDFIREFKSIYSYFFLSKVYTNGWVLGSGGWENACENEKIEAIASDMVKNGNITLEGLELILKTFYPVGVGHLLIVAPDGTYGNVITYNRNDIVKMGVLGDGDYIISPNSPNYRREGHLDNISDVVDSNMNLSANDWYGTFRHCIVAHHIILNESGFSDAVYVSNDDGKYVNRSDSDKSDEFWFKEEFTPAYEIPIIYDKKYLGTYYDLNKTIISQNASKIYGSDYDYSVQLFNNEGDYLDNIAINITINGKTKEYVTDNEGIVTISFTNLVSSQIISLSNPSSGEEAINNITVLPTLVGENLVKYYKNESQFYISLIDIGGNPVSGGNISMNINGVLYNRITNENGTARLNINLAPGEYTLTAFDSLTGCMVSYNITVLPTLVGGNLVKYYKNESQFYISLIDGQGNLVSCINISMNINGVFYNRTTNGNGTARLNINLAPGEYILTAFDSLTGCMMSYNITVLSVLNATDINMTYNDGTQFKVKLVDGKGNPLDNKSISFNINGVFYTRYTNSEGISSLNINLMPGEYIITSQYESAMISNKITISAKEE